MRSSVTGKLSAVMCLLVAGVLTHALDACQTLDDKRNDTMFPIVPRSEWGARDAKLVETFSDKIPFVIIHHSYIPSACTTEETCAAAMRKMQDMHQLQNGWNDIGYSFAVGSDGRVYQGRGYNVVGAHAPRYNDKSIGICLIGDWRTELPPKQMLTVVKAFIAHSMDTGKLSTTYKLLGHRQVRDTECPGERLFKEITSWTHFSGSPSGPSDPKITS